MKEEQAKRKVSRKKEMTKIRAEMKRRMEKQQIKLRKVVEWINKIDKPVARWTKGEKWKLNLLKAEINMGTLLVILQK